MTIRQFELEMAELKRSLVTMGNLVEQSLSHAVRSILHPSANARDMIRPVEAELDALETAIEERAHQIIALQSPRAGDLRFLISATRITSDLEQIGDLAESVAKRATFIAKHQSVSAPAELEPLGNLVLIMLRQTMDAFVAGDMDKAKLVMEEESQTDRMTKACYEAIQRDMEADNTRIREHTRLLRAVGHLEHAGDIIMNIAEETVFIHRATLVRHHHEDMR